MKILSIECSAAPVSVALCDGEKILFNEFSLKKVTHSQTLMPMIERALKSLNLTTDDIDAFAASAGPGSFTGVRIGISTIKGLAAKNKTPCIPLSTLEAMAYMFKGGEFTVCPVMDARVSQLYNALFKVSGGKITRLTPDRALKCEELAKELKALDGRIVICGDGSDVFAPYVKDNGNVSFAPENLKYQNALGVSALANERTDRTVSPTDIEPIYLRLPQAERELKEKRKTK